MKCDDVRMRLPVSVLVGDHWIDGQIGNYDLGHTYGRTDWRGHVQVKFTDAPDDDGIVVKVPVALIDTHLRERKEEVS